MLGTISNKKQVILYTLDYKMKEKILLIVATKAIKYLEIAQTRYVQHMYGENDMLLKDLKIWINGESYHIYSYKGRVINVKVPILPS